MSLSEQLEAVEISAEEKKEYNALMEKFPDFALSPDLQQKILEDIEITVKNDIPTKTCLFFAGLSAYCTPINVSVKGESGSGKTYNAIETIKYFPDKDVMYLGGLSPKAIIHEKGVLLDRKGNPINFNDLPKKPERKNLSKETYEQAKKEYDVKLKEFNEKMKGSYTLIDLTNKIILFLEAPSYDTFEMLKPILSHDKPEISFKFVDKTGKGQMQTRTVVIRGAPVTICLSVEKKYMGEYATRTFTTTPENAKTKIEAANNLTNDKNSFPWEFEEETETFKLTKLLLTKIRNLMIDEHISVVNPFPELAQIFPKNLVRDMRDFQHFNQFLKAFTMLHIYQRPLIEVKGKKYVITIAQDVINALNVFAKILETTRTNTDQRILEFYNRHIRETLSITIESATEKYNTWAETNEEKRLSSFTIRRWFERLEEIAYVDKQEDPGKKSRNLYVPLIKDDPQKNNFADLCKSENLMKLTSNLETGFEKWFNKVLQCSIFHIINAPDNSVIKIDSDTAKNTILLYNEQSCKAIEKAKLELIEQKKKEDLCNLKKQNSAKVISVEPLEVNTTLITCPKCQRKKTLEYTVTDANQDKQNVCGECGVKAKAKLAEAS